MGKVVKAVVGVGLIVVGAVTGNFQLIIAGVQIAGSALLSPSPKGQTRAAAAATVQIGEGSRIALFGEVATAGSLADAFNYGGKYGTDWEVLKLAVADHRCDGLIGFYVGDQYVTFTGDGAVPGYNGQLMVWWRPGTADQDVPSVLTTNGRADASDRGAGVAYVVVAYKADDPEAKKPVWPGGRPRFLWVVRGARCYDARRDSSVGGSGDQRWADPATWAWSDNPIVCRYTWVRGLYACDRVTDPAMLLIGRGLSALEAPPAGVFHRANLCDEQVDGAPRYRVSALIESSATFLSVEEQFAAACAGTISQPEGSVEIDPGEARAAVVTITDDDLLVGSTVSWNERMLGVGSSEWVNTVVARYIEPSMKWQEHSAPVRREVADIIADRQPREERIALGYVIDAGQAGRVAEVRRRLGRLHGRAEITLPPRFAAIEEGDWIVWHSPRRFGPVAFTFRVEAWGSDAGWRHRLSLRQISASVYSDTAPLDDGSIAIVPPAPPAIGAPAAGSWALTAGYQQGSDMQTPVLIVTGARDDRDARFVRFQYAAVTDAPAVWIDAGVTGPDVQRREIVVGAKGTYRVAVSYVVNGVTGDALILGPVTVGALLYPDGTPVQDVQPAEKGATNTGDPDSAFGPDSRVRDALMQLKGLTSAVEVLTGQPFTSVADVEDAVRRYKEGTDKAHLALLTEQALGAARKMRFDALTHLGGVPQGTVIKRVDSERQEGDRLLAESVSLVSAATEKNGETIAAEVLRIDRAIVEGDEAQAEALTTVRAAIEEDVAAEVTRLEKAVADGDSAQAEALTTVRAAIEEDVASEVTRLDKAIADGDSAQAEALTTVRAEIEEGVSSEVTRLDKAIADGDSAQAEALTTVRAEIEEGVSSEIGRLDKAIADGDSAQAEALTTVRAEIEAGVSSEVTRLDKAVADGDKVQAEAIEVVSASLGDVESTVSQHAAALVDIEGKVVAYLQLEVDAGSGRAVVRLAADDRDGSTIDFAANRLRFSNPQGDRMVTAMQLVGGNVEITNDLYMTQGCVVALSGTHMTVMGGGFGRDRRFVRWYGPIKTDIADCSISDAVSYETVDGDTYFGGSLTAGTIRNAVRSTQLASDASVTTGVFTSLGGPRVVTVTLDFRGSQAIDGECPIASDPTAHVQLYRGTDATGTLLAEQIFTGQHHCERGYGWSEPGVMGNLLAGSFTYTDNTGGLQASYYARVASRLTEVAPTQQSLSLISIEE